MRRWLVLSVVAMLAACASRPADYQGPGAPSAAPIVPLASPRPLLALALGSGGTRGFAHIGVIKVLEEAGIAADIISGSSSGAVVAALYAAGHGARILEEIAVGVERDELVDFTLSSEGWVRGEALQDFVNQAVSGRAMENLARPFVVAVTRARDGAPVLFNRGDTGLAVRASASVPKLFVPPVIRGEAYVDGGLTTPVPVRAARAMGADIVIAVDVSWLGQALAGGGDVVEQDKSRLRGVRYRRLEHELEVADVVIVPRTTRTRVLDFERKLEHISAGEDAARAALPRIRELLERIETQKRSATPSGISAR